MKSNTRYTLVTLGIIGLQMIPTLTVITVAITQWKVLRAFGIEL